MIEMGGLIYDYRASIHMFKWAIGIVIKGQGSVIMHMCAVNGNQHRSLYASYGL